MDNDKLIKYLLLSSTNNNLSSHNSLRELLGVNIVNPSSLLRFSFNNMIDGIGDSSYVFSDLEEKDNGIETDYIADPSPMKIEEPIVYIYNTHQRENYNMENLEPYNIKPNVLMASYILREKLNGLGIKTIVETNDITEILRINNWNYAYSYEASKILLKDVMEKNSSLKFFVDLHRDSVSYDKTTASLDGVNYAKILFLVGKEHDNYEQNLALATDLNNILKNLYPDLSRGIYIKEGPGVNGIYNQNLSSNVMLIEMGGQYNTIEEVNNTIPILAKVLYEYIKERL